MINIPVNTEIQIVVLCSDCESPLDIDYKQDLNGDIKILADQCQCLMEVGE